VVFTCQNNLRYSIEKNECDWAVNVDCKGKGDYMWEGIKENFCKRLVCGENELIYISNKIFYLISRMEIIQMVNIVIDFINVKQRWIIQNDVRIDLCLMEKQKNVIGKIKLIVKVEKNSSVRSDLHYYLQQWTKLRSVRKMIILSGKMRVRSKMLLNFIKTIIKIIRGENHRWERKMPFKITLCIHTCSNQEKWKNSGKMIYHSGKSFLSIGKVLRYTGKMIDVKEKCLSL
jgi:hypothetical protein